jgi:hypothetical protein
MVLLLGAIVSAQTRQPESFYTAVFENNFYLITDVQPASPMDTRVRFIKVYPACQSYRAREEDDVLENVSVAQLAGIADLCAPDKVVSTVVQSRKNKTQDEIRDGRQGTAAQCGTELVVHRLPSAESIRFSTLQSKAPRIAALWSLQEQIRQRYSNQTGHEPFAFDTNLGERRLSNRAEREQAAIDIRSGKYDLVLPDLPLNWRKDGQEKLSEVMPSEEEAVSPEADSGVVENPDQLAIEKREPIPYPAMARVAHIQGDVQAEVFIDAESGATQRINALTGHPILRQSATDALRKFIFKHPYSGPNPVMVVVHYKIDCGVMIDTSSSATAKTKKNRKSRKH